MNFLPKKFIEKLKFLPNKNKRSSFIKAYIKEDLAKIKK